MSYDLMAFRPEIAPRTRSEFMNWFHEQTKWSEVHNYDDPAVSSDNMKSWFIEMISSYPAMNGPYANKTSEDYLDNNFVTDYCIGKDVIYVAFSWSVAEQAYEKMKALTEKHKVGFFDTSANEGDILFPGDDGKNHPIDRPGNLSSIQQIKKSASPGQENKTVQEIVYSKITPEALERSLSKDQSKTEIKRTWWKKLFGLK